jgi:hypothetical protein
MQLLYSSKLVAMVAKERYLRSMMVEMLNVVHVDWALFRCPQFQEPELPNHADTF